MGNAVVDVLTGEADPGGRLPTTIPLRLEHNPSYGNFPAENGEIRYGEGLLVGYRWRRRCDEDPAPSPSPTSAARRLQALRPEGHGSRLRPAQQVTQCSACRNVIPAELVEEEGLGSAGVVPRNGEAAKPKMGVFDLGGLEDNEDARQQRVKGFMAASHRVEATEGREDGAVFYCLTRRQLARLLVEYGDSYSHIAALAAVMSNDEFGNGTDVYYPHP